MINFTYLTLQDEEEEARRSMHLRVQRLHGQEAAQGRGQLERARRGRHRAPGSTVERLLKRPRPRPRPWKRRLLRRNSRLRKVRNFTLKKKRNY
jgi:hypothetical protein